MGMNVARLVVDGWDVGEGAGGVRDVDDLSDGWEKIEIPDVPEIDKVPEVTSGGTQDGSIGTADEEL